MEVAAPPRRVVTDFEVGFPAMLSPREGRYQRNVQALIVEVTETEVVVVPRVGFERELRFDRKTGEPVCENARGFPFYRIFKMAWRV